MLVEFKVQRRTSDSIKKTADEWTAAVNRAGFYSPINIVQFVQAVLTPQLQDGLKIRFFRRQELAVAPAYVSFAPLTLQIDERIWRQAQSPKLPGHEEARHVIAHEIGHIVLHRDQPKAFSNLNGRSRFFEPEESSEWQANTFAKFFLIGASEVTEDQAPEQLSKTLRIPVDLAAEVINDLKSASMPGEFCQNCGSLTHLRAGRVLCAICQYRNSTN